MTDRHWFIVETHSRKERLARQNLERQGYPVLSPMVRKKKRRRGKWQTVDEIMFPGYVFIELFIGIDDLAPIRSTIGCKGLVKFGPHPQSVPEPIIRPFVVLGDNPVEVKDELCSGDRVRFETGPLEGLEGIFNFSKGRERAEVLIALLGRQATVIAELTELSKSS